VAGTLADDYLPAYDVVMRHAVSVAAPAPTVWAALHRADFADAWYVRALLALRGLRRPGSASRRLTLDRLVDGGFIALGERAGREFALGLVGRFWMPSGGRVKVRPDAFRDFAEPGNAKAVWTFAVEPLGTGTRLVTETRVQCLDAASRRRFRLYWLVVRPFSGLIRHAMLGAVAREATRPAETRPV
jgi:hypothetical protein